MPVKILTCTSLFRIIDFFMNVFSKVFGLKFFIRYALLKCGNLMLDGPV